MQDLVENTEQQKKGRIIFVLMAIFFMVPMLVVILMYRFDWRPQAGGSYGTLIQPAKQIQMGAGQTAFWQEKWNMVYVAERCEQTCMNNLHDMRQIHVSMYKDIMRVQRVLVTLELDVSAIKTKYPDLQVVNTPEQAQALMQQFEMAPTDAPKANRLYLVDPLGYAVMHYPPAPEAKRVRQDLVKLLKFSWAG